MKNEPMWRERLQEKFAGLHNVKNWVYEECDCNEKPYKSCIERVEAFIESELSSLGRAMVEILEKNKLNNFNLVNLGGAKQALTAELSKRGININHEEKEKL